MSTHLEKQILATIVYYDILDYPLTGLEVFLYLVKKNVSNNDCRRHSRMSPTEIIELLNTSEYLKKHLEQKNGFYFLKERKRTVIARESQRPKQSRDHKSQNLNTGLLRHSTTLSLRSISRNDSDNTDIVQLRLNRKKIWDQKWKKARKIFWIMQVIPFSRLVMGSGSFSLGNTRKDSDVDLMIVAKKGRIWTVRTFFTLLTSFLGVRRYKDKTEDKICLNHYITDKSLRIPFESIYTAHLYCHILNVYNSKKDRKLFKKFQEGNKWMKKYLQNYEFSELEGFRSIKRNKILNFIAKFFEFILSGKIGDYFEKIMSEIQTKRIKKDPLNLKKGGRITISDDQLEFHPNSHEAKIVPKFNKKMEELELFEFGKQKDSGLV